MSKLTKSLSELDALADEILSKSANVDPDEIDEEVDVAEVIDDAEGGEPAEIDEEKMEVKGKKKQPESKMKKSAAADDDNDELKPEDISENVPEDKVQNTDEVQEEDEKSEDTDEEDEEEKETKEEVEKSMKSKFMSNDNIKKSVDASEFLSAVVDIISKSLADVVYNIGSSQSQSMDNDNVIAKSMKASINMDNDIIKSINVIQEDNDELHKSIEDGFEDLKDYIDERFEQMGHQPSMRKSVPRANTTIHDRDFNKSINGSNVGADTLSKSEVMAKLNNYMYSGNPIVQASDIISFESGAPLRAEVAELIYGNN